MAKKITPKNNASNMVNANKGTPGVNKQYAQNQSNIAKTKANNTGGKKK